MWASFILYKMDDSDPLWSTDSYVRDEYPHLTSPEFSAMVVSAYQHYKDLGYEHVYMYSGTELDNSEIESAKIWLET